MFINTENECCALFKDNRRIYIFEINTSILLIKLNCCNNYCQNRI